MNAQVTKFMNEDLRPLCEQVRRLKLVGSAVLLRWNQEILPLVAKDQNVVDDGREAEGVSRLTGNDIHAAMTVLQTLNSALDANPDLVPIINKPCVRGLLEQ